MSPLIPPGTIRFAVPKGRMYDGIVRLLNDAGIRVGATARDYRPAIGLPGFETKILKPRAIVEMLHAGTRDLGFAGADWVAESDAQAIELLDTRLDPVRLVAAAPAALLEDGWLPKRPLVVASEYVGLATRWISTHEIDATLLPSYGATEVLPPEDADCIIDNTATGATLAANDLKIIDELMTSTTRLYASRAAMADAGARNSIETFVMLVRSVIEARKRVMLELNVSAERLEALIAILPCMREPTVSPLHGAGGYAVKAAVPRADLPSLIPALKSRGGSDIVVTTPEQIVV